MAKRLIVFLLISSAALLIGGLFTGPGVESIWYKSLNQAPWTPPGWVFGVAWTVVMLFYSLYWAFILPLKENKHKAMWFFALQILLNVLWNPLFFYFQLTTAALIVLSSLFISIAVLFIANFKMMKSASLLLVPYLVWLSVAFSLNAYIVVNN